ncbi:hypothetical protein C8P63_11028 [Melghirimyces profundicolus]|uniref:Uncharacterized protein n=1 Tax=Melghirimyces profundicolus TaxID=1242148 RepID=A0A2T6BUZ5_9BACL|nr:hypothetical protein [Melghirimyces profundicolus]PTX59884.1 hypothetical protein C8P63_11028 [Melghirimyces profundicolus]
MKALFLCLPAVALVFFYRSIITSSGFRRGVGRSEVRRRSRRFTFWVVSFAAGLTLFAAGVRVGLIGGAVALGGGLILAGALTTGLMKLRDWLS